MFSRKNIALIYHYVLTTIFYKPFLKKVGKKFIIVDPIWFTPKYLTVGNNVTIRNNARIEGVFKYGVENYSPEIIIGNDVKIQQNLHLTCASIITIGNNTAIAANVTITDIDHGYEDITLPPEKQPLKITPVNIGADCKIYNNAVLLPGTILGKHVIVGANSVVKGQFPDFCLIAGIPAKIIKYYNYEINQWVKSDHNI
ncbi:MAG: lacA 3 [Mucilaginibacter sp.]|nr:lacA 3 [Mucilaginibacter sp.]